MKFAIEIDSDDAEATNDPRGLIRRCLKLVGERVEADTGGHLWDINGNEIGEWFVALRETADDEDE